MKTMITHRCAQCNKEFTHRLNNRRNGSRQKYCSIECRDNSHRTALPVTCDNCGIQFEKHPSRITKTNHNFCSQSCAATYRNTHRTTGTRRSKLESYLESQIRSEFPDLTLICNGKDAIGSELDFYFPQLRLAIELNGIFHYEPIYGSDKLEQIQANDQQKSLRCAAAGIELCIISCTESYVTKIVKERYWSIIKNLVAPLLGRAGNTNMQVS
jgi:very-short-patch-repair endonuclease